MRPLLLALLFAPACSSHSLVSARLTMPAAEFPVSMSEYIVVDTTATSRADLDVITVFAHRLPCVKLGTTVDVSQAINDQLRAAGGEGLIGLGVTLASTADCQDVTLVGEIVRRRGGR